MEFFWAVSIGSGQHDGASSGPTGQPSGLRACAECCWAWLEAAATSEENSVGEPPSGNNCSPSEISGAHGH